MASDREEKVDSTYATMTVTIEVRNLGSWGPQCQIDQVYRQAAESAIGYLSKLAQQEKGKFRIIGNAKVTAVMSTVDRP